MTLIILGISLIGLLLIATESFNHISKAAVAMFAGVSCWLLFIVYGKDFVLAHHAANFVDYLGSDTLTSERVKSFIATNIFFKYIVDSANIVLFLIATTSIVEVLNNNGCFDFLGEWLRTRNPRKLLWLLALFTVIVSANLDNLATVVLIISILHPLLQNDRQRRIYGTVVILSANCGGAITAIGDLTSLSLWNSGLISPSTYFLTLVIPVTASLVTMLYLISRTLPVRIELSLDRLPYRGDDTVLSRPQRLLMFFVGVGGLWFIPSFHRITLLPPFVGALCVLGLLWIVNELCNRQLMKTDQMVLRRLPLALQYSNLQNILYFVGLTLMFGALRESGIFNSFCHTILSLTDNIYVISAGTGILSCFFGHVPTLLGGISLFSEHATTATLPAFGPDGIFWPLLSYTTALGGSVLLTGTIAGLMLMRIENISFGWYFRHIAPKVLAGFMVGFIFLVCISAGLGKL